MLIEQTERYLGEKRMKSGLVEALAENQGSDLYKWACRSCYISLGPEDFPPFIGKANFDSAKFLKWNNLTHPERDNENKIIQISDSESDFSNDKIYRRKKRKKRKKKNLFLN